MRGFPGIHRKIRQIRYRPLTGTHISRMCHRHTASPFFVTENIKDFSTFYHNTRTGNRNHLSASSLQCKRSLAVCHLTIMPYLPVIPDNAILRDFTVRTPPISGNIRIATSVCTHTCLVYQFRVLWNTTSILCIRSCNRKFILFTIRLIPSHSVIKRTRVAKIMVGLHLPGFTPYP